MTARRTLASATALLVAITVVVLPASTRAQDGDAAAARSLFSRGLAAMEEGRFGDAVAALRESLTLAPRSATAFNLAVSLRGQGELIAAEQVFGEMLEGRFGRLDTAQAREVAALRSALAQDIAMLHLRVEGPAETRVQLDGAELALERGEAEVRIDPGEHNVSATAVDHEASDQRIAVEPGARIDLAIRMVPRVDQRPGVLVLESSDPSAQVEIIGVAEGAAPLARTLEPGRYRVRARGAGGTRESEITVPAGRRVRLVLEPPPQRSLLEEPWLWVGVGVVVAAGAGVGIWALVENEQPAERDPFWGTALVVR
jgi:hypothetical protein